MTKIIEYFKFVAKQLTHLQPWSYYLWFLGVGFQLGILFSAPLTALSVVSFFGTVLGLGCVISIAACRSINGWLGLISAACFIYVAYAAKNYLTIGEQLSYVVTLDIPVLVSLDWNKNVASKVRSFNLKSWVISLISTVIVWLASSYGISFVGDPRPLTDGLVFAVSLTAGIITFLRYNNNFIWWTFVGVFQIALWGLTALQGDASIAMLISSLMYLANDIMAFTLSPWFNRRTRAKVIKQDKAVFNE